MNMRLPVHRHTLSRLLLVCLLLSVFGVWLHNPQPTRAYYNCNNCYAKVGWTGERGTVAGESGTIHIPQNIAVGNGTIHDAIWVWDDQTGSFNSVGIVAYNGTNNVYYYVATNSEYGYSEYPEDFSLPSGNRGYDTYFYLYRNVSRPNTYYYGYHSADVNVDGLVFGNGLETRSMIGNDSDGTGLGFWYTSWRYNRYIYDDGSAYYHLSWIAGTAGQGCCPYSHNSPWNDYWNPDPQGDPNHEGGTYEHPGA